MEIISDKEILERISALDSTSFENLTLDLLRAVGFRNIATSPRFSSSSLMALDNGDCSMCSFSAARAKWSSSATARKYQRCRSSIIGAALSHDDLNTVPSSPALLQVEFP